ncbi:hypothetical protein H0H81_012085 [Sphagnurus paluster]|uniref:Flavin-containing monooxygenase n=1 Tax=Sphagnurus paluster TaxID=117069 RepID=A0A9P7KKE7_9AGAR|nr:hypothetical protein H0H81_012085 [Sphagnurus paluster]
MHAHKRQKLSADPQAVRELESDAESPAEESEYESGPDENSGSDNDSADTSDEVIVKQKSRQTSKRKIRATKTSTFGATLQSLLSTDAPSSLPLSLKPSIARKRNDEKLENKAKKVLQVEKKEKEDKGRITDVIGGWGGESERALRKVAQRGVVKLFNVIQQSQASVAAATEESKAARGSGKPTLPAPVITSKTQGRKAKDKDNIIGRGKETRHPRHILLESLGLISAKHATATDPATPTTPRPLEAMVNVRQVVFSLLGSRLRVHDAQSYDTKSIAIVGAGSAGLAMLKTLLDLPESTRYTWDIVLFEERKNLGGVWLPDPDPALPPEIPETPLYPLLRTNTPVPSMTYPGFPFTPGTALYPAHEEVEAYLVRYATHYNLTRRIRFNHKILEASWLGSPAAGQWNVSYYDANGATRHGSFDHLVVATGNNHLPRIPTWPGQEEWLANSPPSGAKREIVHSVWYRGPEKYRGLNVLVVGTGSSGRDIATQIIPYAEKTYISVRSKPNPLYGSTPDGAVQKPDISHFTAAGVVFRDGTTLKVDAVLLGTGYEIRKPFLERGGVLVTDPHSRAHADKLATNTRYVYPLHQHLLSLSPAHPTNALAFIGLPSAIANCPSDIAQSLFVAHAILNGTLLPPRDELLRELARREEGLRRAGYDPYRQGHMLPVNTSSDYQDELVAFLKERGAIPDDGKKFVEQWRRDIFTYGYLRQGWKRIESLGLEREWLEGVETEAQWAELMARVNRWQEEWEKSNGIAFRPDLDLVG